LARPAVAQQPVRHAATPLRTNCRRSRRGAGRITNVSPVDVNYRDKLISTSVSRSSPIHASSRTEPTQTSTRPSGASSVTDPSRPVTANVPPQTNPHPFTMTRCSGRGRPSRPRTMTSKEPLRRTSSSSGDHSSIEEPSCRAGCRQTSDRTFDCRRSHRPGQQFACLIDSRTDDRGAGFT
jgi:hypothetical protein